MKYTAQALKLLQSEVDRRAKNRPRTDLLRYRDDPSGYARDILGLTLTPKQEEVVSLLLKPPRKVLVSSGHSVGKSLLGAVLVNWFFDTREGGICLTTAPTERQVKGILWKEIRRLREKAKLPACWAGPKIPMLETSAYHFAMGFTARDATRFQGQHEPGGVLIIFDEAEGIEVDFFHAMKTMLDDQSYFAAFYNPTGGSGTATHEAEQQAEEKIPGKDYAQYRRATLSCLDHPNIKAQEKGEPLVIPGAITLDQLQSMLLEDSMVLGPSDAPQDGDVVLAGVRYRPGPIAQARCLGRRPSQSTSGVWFEQLWQRVLATKFEPRAEWPVAIGCDVARYGDNNTVIVVRKGYCVLHAEVHSKIPTNVTAQKLREACHRFQDKFHPAKQIPVMIDEGGVGSGVLDQSEGYLFVAVNASHKPRNPARYKNVRSELWFNAREAALSNCMDVSRLPSAFLGQLKSELMAAQYRVIPGKDQLEVTSKDDMVELLKRSPDRADAFNLAFYPPPKVLKD